MTSREGKRVISGGEDWDLEDLLGQDSARLFTDLIKLMQVGVSSRI